MGDNNDELKWLCGFEHTGGGKDKDNKIIIHMYPLLKYKELNNCLHKKFTKKSYLTRQESLPLPQGPPPLQQDYRIVCIDFQISTLSHL